MKKALLLLIALQTCLLLGAQTDSTRSYILSYRDPKTEIISKGRRLLFSKLLQGDTSRVAEVVDYLVKAEDENFLALYPQEKCLLYYWTGQYSRVLVELPAPRLGFYGRFFFRGLYPEPDPLFSKLTEVLTGQESEVTRRINAAALGEDTRHFLILNLLYQLAASSYRVADSTVADADAFLKAHPGSPYETYVRRYIKREVVRSKCGLGIEFFSGYGILTEALKTHFNGTVPIGVAFDVTYKNLTLYLRDFIGFARTRDTLNFPAGSWKKGAQARVFLPEASLGYGLVEGRRFKLSPFVGIASCSISPTENDKQKGLVNDDVELKFTTTFTIGLNLDWKLGRPPAPVTSGNKDAYGFLRIRYAYNSPQFKKKYGGFSGNLHYITVGIGGFSRTVKRSW